MKAIFISCNQALYDEVQQTMEQLGVRGYTAWEELMGSGTTTGEPHLGSTTWPTMNSSILSIVEDDKYQPFMAALKTIDDANPHLGLRAFWWEVGGTR